MVCQGKGGAGDRLVDAQPFRQPLHQAGFAGTQVALQQQQERRGRRHRRVRSPALTLRCARDPARRSPRRSLAPLPLQPRRQPQRQKPLRQPPAQGAGGVRIGQLAHLHRENRAHSCRFPAQRARSLGVSADIAIPP